jgi:hypothetical protein
MPQVAGAMAVSVSLSGFITVGWESATRRRSETRPRSQSVATPSAVTSQSARVVHTVEAASGTARLVRRKSAFAPDGSAKGRDGIGRGNCFVIAGLVVAVPFTDRNVFLPLLFRLHLPKVSASKTEQARVMVDLLAQAFPDRRVHVVGDALYRGPAWLRLPTGVTFTTRLASNSVLHAPAPPRTGRRGRPALKGARLGKAIDLAATAEWTTVTVKRYGQSITVQVAVRACLWHGSLRHTPVNVVLVRDPAGTKAYDIALVTTDTTATAATIVERYADRWSIEQAIKDSKDLLGNGNVRPRRVARSLTTGTPTLRALLSRRSRDDASAVWRGNNFM